MPPANAKNPGQTDPGRTLALVPGGHLEIVTSASDLGSRITQFLAGAVDGAA